MALAGILKPQSADLGASPSTGERDPSRKEIDMTRLWAILLILASFVLVAPVVESGTSDSLALFVAVGNADSGGGGE
jgi:hypothetical protein